MPRPKPITAFLTARDAFFIHPSFPIEVSDCEKILGRTAQLYLLGYVDYQDQFGRKHRHGYARVYDVGNHHNNLVFVPQAGYNYDRVLS
jgi:hypothetical protein